MEKIINITIDGETYLKYKQAYEGIKANKHAIDFGNIGFNSYGWTFYTEDAALIEMAELYKFIQFKHLEQYESYIAKRDKQIEELKNQIADLKKKLAARDEKTR